MLEELTCSYKNRCNYKWIKNYDVGFLFFFPIRWKYKRLIICKSLWWTRNKTRPRRQRGKSNPASCPHSVADYFPKTAQRAERYSLRVRRFDPTSRSLGQNVSWKPTGVRVQISSWRRVQSSVFQRRCISVQALTSLMASESILKAWGILLQGRIRPNFCLNSFDWEFKRLFEAWVSSAENPEGRRSYVTGIFCHFSQGYVLLNCRFALLIERYGVSWVTAASFCRGERKDVWKKRCGRPVTLWNPGLSCIYSLDRK